jgi:hypothetical protein
VALGFRRSNLHPGKHDNRRVGIFGVNSSRTNVPVIASGLPFRARRNLAGFAGALIGGVICLASAEPPMEYRHNAPESPDDNRYGYHWKILETALEKTMGKYGGYKLESG